VRQGEGVGAFVSYKVRSSHNPTNAAAASAAGFSPAAEAVRRFRDFSWLRAALAASNRGTIIPPLPERSAVQKFAMTPKFVEARRAALEVFLRRCAAHPRLRASRELRLFLEAAEDEFALEVARSAAAGGPGPGGAPAAAGVAAAAGAQRAASVAAGWMRSLTAATSALVAGARSGSGGGGVGSGAYGGYGGAAAAGGSSAYADAMGFGGAAGGNGAAGVGTGIAAGAPSYATTTTTAANPVDASDPEFARVREYLAHLEAHLSEAHKQAARLVKKEQEAGEAVAAFGAAVERLGRLEDAAGPAAQEAFAALARKAAALAAASAARTAALSRDFEAPLKEAARGAKAAQEACADRAAAAAAAHAAQHELDARKVRWARLRGTPGTPADRLAEAERDTADAERKLRGLAAASAAVAGALDGELGRWQRERAEGTAGLLRAFAEEQAALAADGARLWGGLLAELQALLGQQQGVQQ
jgi:hypothetical protein